jgi:WD40 repeat protein
LAVLPGGDRIAVGLIGNEVCTDINIWDVAKSDKPVMSYRGHGDTVSSMAPFAGRGGLVSAGFDKTVRATV